MTTPPTCPECGATLDLPSTVMQGEIIPCPDCGLELEIVSVQPLALGLAPAVEEDWGE